MPLLKAKSSVIVPLTLSCLSLHNSELSPLSLKTSPKYLTFLTGLISSPFRRKPSLPILLLFNSSHFSTETFTRFSCWMFSNSLLLSTAVCLLLLGLAISSTTLMVLSQQAQNYNQNFLLRIYLKS